MLYEREKTRDQPSGATHITLRILGVYPARSSASAVNPYKPTKASGTTTTTTTSLASQPHLANSTNLEKSSIKYIRKYYLKSAQKINKNERINLPLIM